jgi:DNA-binding GntR family transcriptional regulator
VSDPRKPDTTKKRIYEHLRRSIVLGKLKPGEKLQLDYLADEYKTSVTPVREAMQMLAQEELVTSKPHQGYFVSRITLKELTDLMELRQILELAAVEMAAPKITDQQLEELESIHETGLNGEIDHYERAVEENRRFHYLIALASGNRELAEYLGRVHDRLARFFVLVHSPEEVKNRHILLINALRSHDVTLARQTLLTEINETRDFTLSHIVEKDGTAWYISQNQEK